MKKIYFSHKELEACDQINAYEKLLKIAGEKGNADLLLFAEHQRQQWCNEFFDGQIIWLENITDGDEYRPKTAQ